MKAKTHSERLYVIETKLDNLIEEIKGLKEANTVSEKKYALRSELMVLTRIVYGSIAFALTTVVTVLLLLL